MRFALVALLVVGCAARPYVGHAGTTSSAKQDTGSARTACHEPVDCTLVLRDPCHCGLPDASDYEALSSTWAESHPSSSVSGSCPDCLTERSEGIYATCGGGRCRVLDVSTSAHSRCTTDADCTAIDPACCPPCGPTWHMVGVARGREGRLRRAVCGPGWDTVGCPACASPAPPVVNVACVSRHCVVTP